jgi:hypothetical protein
MISHTGKLALVTGAFLLVSSVAPNTGTLHMFPSSVAFAAQGGNGNGQGRGHGNSNAGNNGNSAAVASAASGGVSAASIPEGATPTARHLQRTGWLARLFGTARAEEVRGGQNLHARMGALNAVHASQKAFENAASNSRVGLIAAYAEARSAKSAEIARLTSEIDGLRADLAALENDPGATQNAIIELLAMKEAELSAIEAALLALLERAANKPVTAEVQAEVDRILIAKGML